ncbi:GTA baseplate fiber-binding domain-containing protein [Allosphingosinicella humi]
MATVVLTAVGAAVGGPIGAMIGAIVGQQIDAELFEPKGRRGPRMGDLSIQTSSYGTALPKLFGTMRVAGTVVWATDLRESSSSSGGGKGQPKTTRYTYSCSFAVALSARAIRNVRRIWADGNLLRGVAGDFKSSTGFRLYLGGEDQAPDPLIASIEGSGETPAFRGIAYAVFEDFQLADFGNRIPSLTFEVEADPEAIPIGAIAETLSDGQVVDEATPSLAGYAASGDTVRSAIETLMEAAPLSLRDEGDRLVIGPSAGPALLIAADETGARARPETGGESRFERRADGSVATDVSIAYYDTARDFQAGLQRATRGRSAGPWQGVRGEHIALPAALSASSAKAIAERRLASLWAGRATAEVHCPWRRSDIRPGRLVEVEARAGRWKVERWTLDRMVASLELVRVQSGQAPVESAASPGRLLVQPDGLHGPTTIRLLELPLSGDGAAENALLFAAANGVEEGWRKAMLTASMDGGASWQAEGVTAAPAVMGSAVSALAPRGSALIDLDSSVEVTLLNDAMWLEGRSDEALASGANLAALGAELIQFGEALPLGERRFRLSRLLRGRRGTEWAAGGHGPGEDFTLIAPGALTVIECPPAMLGGEVRLLAVGVGDATPASVTCPVGGEALRPPAPVHLAALADDEGGLAIQWVRRSRSGWSWPSGSDTPLGEEREAYQLTLTAPGFERAIATTEPSYAYTAAERAADGWPAPLTISVVQVGTFASSRPAQILVA